MPGNPPWAASIDFLGRGDMINTPSPYIGRKREDLLEFRISMNNKFRACSLDNPL